MVDRYGAAGSQSPAENRERDDERGATKNHQRTFTLSGARRRNISERLPYGAQLRSKARVNFDRIQKHSRGIVASGG
jgi:hypothetical protein